LENIKNLNKPKRIFPFEPHGSKDTAGIITTYKQPKTTKLQEAHNSSKQFMSI
jgi:hypothetical protein